MSPFDLTGLVAAVTGGNGGIGLGIARGLSAAGARVALGARSAAKTERAVAELEAAGGQALGVEVDVSSDEDVARFIDATVARFGRLDILVNNAGISVRGKPEELSLADYGRVLEVNLTAALRCSQRAYPELKKAGGGKIINIGSLTSVFGSSFALPYAVSKGGLVQLTRSLAISWAPDGIQVNAILPGWIDTELTAGTRQHVPSLDERVVARTPAGRWGQPSDVAGAAVFLASRAADFVTGAVVAVDGGYSIAL
jgi:2-dehydro-3-deoxy-D-gluconate 5-dehydrogenase